MKFDTVIIGGGLSGLTCGVRLQKQGKRCVIVSAGQSALHFSSGSFDLLNRLADGTEVVSPVEQVSGVDKAHPYVKLGDKFAFYAAEAQKLMADCGVELQGSADKNHYHFTPMGTMKPSWLTISDFDCYDNEAPFKGKKVMLLNISGFLDFNTKFIADALETAGASCMIKSISLPELNKLRVSPTEMRSTNIAKVMCGGSPKRISRGRLNSVTASFPMPSAPWESRARKASSVSTPSFSEISSEPCRVPTSLEGRSSPWIVAHRKWPSFRRGRGATTWHNMWRAAPSLSEGGFRREVRQGTCPHTQMGNFVHPLGMMRQTMPVSSCMQRRFPFALLRMFVCRCDRLAVTTSKGTDSCLPIRLKCVSSRLRLARRV